MPIAFTVNGVNHRFPKVVGYSAKTGNYSTK